MKINNIAFLFSALLFIVSVLPSAAQISFSNGAHNIEISGLVAGFYNQRFYKKDDREREKNRFELRNAVLQLEGRYKNLYEYELQYNFAKSSSGVLDLENPALMDAWVKYKGIPYLEITAGYQKLPYSRASMTPFQFMPWFQRAEAMRGELFSRRDIGILASSSLWKQRINLYTGAFTGQGESILSNQDNDISGQLEYVGRMDVSWPSRMRYREIDNVHVPIPLVSVGINGRYTEKDNTFPNTGYKLISIDGTKATGGYDLTLQYEGLTATFESHIARYVPHHTNRSRLQGKDTYYFQAGGYGASANYHSKKLRSILGLRYDSFNASDLIPDNNRDSWSFSYCFMVDGFNSMIKVQYWMRAKALNKYDGEALSGTQGQKEYWQPDQVRVGWQYLLH